MHAQLPFAPSPSQCLAVAGHGARLLSVHHDRAGPHAESAPGAAQNLTPVSVSLGDVSLNKVAFLVAADNGIYQKYGLNVHQFITASAADRIQRSGIAVPDDFVGKSNGDDAQISVGGGSPLINWMTTDARATQRVILATTDSEAGFHVVSNTDVASLDDLKGKRLGYSAPGSVSHLMALALLKQKGWSPGPRHLTDQ